MEGRWIGPRLPDRVAALVSMSVLLLSGVFKPEFTVGTQAVT